MRFGFVHRLMTDSLATLGILAVVCTSTLSTTTTLVLLVGLVGALAVPASIQTRPGVRLFATLAPIGLFLFQLFRLFLGTPPLDVAVEFAAFLQILRLATRRGAAHDQQIIILALLHFVAGTVLGGGIAFGLCFLGFLTVAPGALVLSHLRREVEGNYRQGARDRTGLPVDVPRILRSRRVVGRGFLISTCLLAVPILLFTVILFVLFPRVGLSLLLMNHPRAGRMVGFSDHVDLGQVGVLRTDPSIALRFEVKDLTVPPPTRMTLRLRGTAFDTYDGRSWQRSQAERRPAETAHARPNLYALVSERRPDPFLDRRMTVDLEPIDPPVVFLPPRAVGVEVRPYAQSILGEPTQLIRGPEDEVRYLGADGRGLRYEVYVARDDEAFPAALSSLDLARYLTLPKNLSPRVRELAHTWTEGFATPTEKAREVERRLRTEYRYDVGSPSSGTDEPIDHFLFESHRGHCEFFSTALAVLLRSEGIPTRNVTGFVGGTYNRFGNYYAVREGDAHSWVEVFLEFPKTSDSGTHLGIWYTFEPTPSAAAQPLHETQGAWVFVRDLAEALSQRWNRYVVGYDMKTQVRILDRVSRGYDGLRARTGTNRGMGRWLTHPPRLALLFVVLGTTAYVIWKRRRTRKTTIESRTKGDLDRSQQTILSLYRQMETALRPHGIERAPTTPPLRYAESLCQEGHPLGKEVLNLTEIYLDVRYGGKDLSPQAIRDFEALVRTIRHTPRLPKERQPRLPAS